jgi:hypothetical protein
VTQGLHARSGARGAAVIGLLSVIGLSHAAEAQTKPAPNVAVTDTPEAIYERGLRSFDQGHFDDAADDFARSYETVRQARCLWNLALAEYRAQRTVQALEHLRLYVHAPDATPTNVGRAQRLITDLEPKVERVTVTTEQGASVTVDGRPRGIAPLSEPIDLDPASPHTVVVRLGGRSVSHDLPASAPGALSLALALPPPPTLIVSPMPTPVPTAPAAAAAPSPRARTNTLRLVLAGGLAAGAVLATGVGAYLNLQGEDEASQADSYRQQIPMGACPAYAHCADLADAVHANRQDISASRWLYAAGGVLAAGALATFFLMPSKVRSETAMDGRVLPIVDPVGRGVGVVGNF